MVTEMEQTVGGSGGVEYAEHSRKSGAKKVVPGVSAFPYQPATTPESSRTIDPINGVVGAAAVLTLIKGKAYRVIADVAFHFRMSSVTSAAVITDILVPAFEPIFVSTKNMHLFAHIAHTIGGTIQAVEVE